MPIPLSHLFLIFILPVHIFSNLHDAQHRKLDTRGWSNLWDPMIPITIMSQIISSSHLDNGGWKNVLRTLHQYCHRVRCGIQFPQMIMLKEYPYIINRIAPKLTTKWIGGLKSWQGIRCINCWFVVIKSICVFALVPNLLVSGPCHPLLVLLWLPHSLL